MNRRSKTSAGAFLVIGAFLLQSCGGAINEAGEPAEAALFTSFIGRRRLVFP